MKKTLKKGFTIVELVIVIAVVAILAAVLIPTFVSVVNKANVSNDTALVRNLNSALISEEATGNKPATMSDVVDIAEEYGYNVENLQTKASGYKLLWNQETNRFYVQKDGEKITTNPEVENIPADGCAYWEISDTVSEKHSTYLNGYSGAAEITDLKTGLDVGKVTTIISLSYIGNTASQTVTINTNSFDTVLTVNAEKDTVKHYGEAKKINVVKVAMSSYHEFGTVAGNIEISNGRLEIEESAKVKTVIVTGEDVSVSHNDETINILVSESVPTDKQPIINGQRLSEESNKAILVDNYNDLKQALWNGKTVILNADITCSKYIVLQGTTMKNNATSAVLNLNGHIIKYTSKQYFIRLDDRVHLTIEGPGKVEVAVEGVKLFEVQGATLTINGGEYFAEKNDANSSLIHIKTSTYGKVIINDGVFHSNEVCVGMTRNADVEINGGEFTSKDNFVIGTSGSEENGDNKIVINDGIFNGNIETDGYIACGIYIANTDVVTVNGGTFNIKNGAGIVCRSGKTTIGENVVINIENDGTIVSGMVGDSEVLLNVSSYIVKDEKSDYPAGAPEIINNSQYNIVEYKDKNMQG